jgi:hypothetical protein
MADDHARTEAGLLVILLLFVELVAEELAEERIVLEGALLRSRFGRGEDIDHRGHGWRRAWR